VGGGTFQNLLINTFCGMKMQPLNLGPGTRVLDKTSVKKKSSGLRQDAGFGV
jgi:hypothetical protein